MVLYVCMIFCCCFTSLESLKQKKKKVSKKAKLFKIACKIGWSTEKSTLASDQIFVRPCTRSFYIFFSTPQKNVSPFVFSLLFVCVCMFCFCFWFFWFLKNIVIYRNGVTVAPDQLHGCVREHFAIMRWWRPSRI